MHISVSSVNGSVKGGDMVFDCAVASAKLKLQYDALEKTLSELQKRVKAGDGDLADLADTLASKAASLKKAAVALQRAADDLLEEFDE